MRRFVRKTFRQGISLQHFFQVACLGRFVRKTNCQDMWDYKMVMHRDPSCQEVIIGFSEGYQGGIRGLAGGDQGVIRGV